MSISRLFLGEAKFKTIISTLSQRPKQYVAGLIRSIFSHFIHHIPEWLSLISIFAFNAWYYGYSTVTRYAYGTSDLVVHQKWINAMDQGTIFYDGIYPFGFHNILYFLHTFFGFSTTTLLRTFNVTQMFFIYTMIYVVLKKSAAPVSYRLSASTFFLYRICLIIWKPCVTNGHFHRNSA